MKPTILHMPNQSPQVHEETFAPILYVMGYETLDEAIAMQNAVPQGLSSALFTNSLRAAERFLSATGSDCGIANVKLVRVERKLVGPLVARRRLVEGGNLARIHGRFTCVVKRIPSIGRPRSRWLKVSDLANGRFG